MTTFYGESAALDKFLATAHHRALCGAIPSPQRFEPVSPDTGRLCLNCLRVFETHERGWPGRIVFVTPAEFERERTLAALGATHEL